MSINTTTNYSPNFEINKRKFASYQFNEKFFDTNLIDSLKKADHILISIPPVNGEDLVIKHFSTYLLNYLYTLETLSIYHLKNLL